MKKSLLSLSLLALLGSSAYAQSSVTLFGIVDLNVNSVKNGSAGTIQSLSSGALNTSRLGFRGIEDLGGGLKAGFHLEGGLSPDVGAADTTRFFGRRSTVSLLGGFGEVRIGHDYNPSSRNTYLFEPYVGTGVGTVLNFTLAPTAALGSGVSTMLRSSNSVTYFLPSMGGLYGEAMLAAGEGTPGAKYAGGRLGFQVAGADVSAGYGVTETATSNDFKQFNVGASYTMGTVKLMGLYNVHKYGVLEQKTYLLGAKATFGQSEFNTTYGRNNRSGGAVGSGFGDADDASLISAGYTYNLSKRTALYAMASQISNKGASRLTVTGTAAPAGMLGGEKSTGVQGGISHRF